MEPAERQAFFISRAGPDAEFARWLAGELQSDGHHVFYQDGDFGHGDFMAKMADGFAMVDGGARLIALLSPDYMQREKCMQEARYPLIDDTNNTRQRLVALAIRPCEPTGHLKSIAYTDLLAAREQGASVLRDAIWIALGLTPRDPAAAPAPLRQSAWLHPEVYRDPRFRGREDLLARIDAALKDNSTLALKALNGAGGVGKSTLAREYAARHAGDYEGVWWIRAETPETMASDLVELGAKYISGLAGAQDRDAAVRAALEAVENQSSGKDWLLVYDNVPKPEALAGRTPRRGAQILATTRHTSWQGRAGEVDVDVFPADVATDFLLERTGRDDRDGAAEVAERLGYLPLALEQAASYLAEAPTMGLTGPGGYLSYLDEMIRRAPVGMEADRSVYGAVSLSLETAQGQHEKAEDLFGLIAFMEAEAIPVALLRGADGFDGLAFDDALAALARTSLIKHTPFPDGEAALRVHRLSQDVMRARLGKVGKETDALEAALALLAPALAALHAQDVRNWPALDRLDPHAMTAFGHAERLRHAGPALATVLNEIGLLRFTRAQYGEAEPLMRRALEIDEASFGPDHLKVAIRLNNLARLLQETNRLAEAEPLMRRVVEIFEKALGETHPNVALALNNLALLLQNTNRLVEAEPLYRRALAIDEATHGPAHPNVARDLNNLAALLRATNRLGEAEPLYRRALAIDEASYGPDHPDVARDLNNLAQLLRATNRLAEAEPLMRRALAIDKASYGPDHPDVATDLNNLAGLLQATNRLAEAEPLMRRALTIFRASLPEGHPNIEVVAGNLAVIEAEMAAAVGAAPSPQVPSIPAQAGIHGHLPAQVSAETGGAQAAPGAPPPQTTPPLDAARPSPAPSGQHTPRRGGLGMIIRQIAGAALLALGLWLGWGTLQPFLAYTSRGADAGAALADPVFLIPAIRSGFAIFAGLLALVRWPGASLLAALATFLTALMGGLLALNGADSSMWVDDMVYAGVLFLITCVFLLRQRMG